MLIHYKILKKNYELDAMPSSETSEHANQNSTLLTHEKEIIIVIEIIAI